ERVQACLDAGIARHQLLIDPGFGFGKTLDHNLCLLQHLEDFQALGLPVLVGMSRKSFLGALLNASVTVRLHAGLAAATLAVCKGARLVRTHDVGPTVEALRFCAAVGRVC
ncbi:MAG: dihydropteroate synthase, partial [Gammaproteobacteria bacterium]